MIFVWRLILSALFMITPELGVSAETQRGGRVYRAPTSASAETDNIKCPKTLRTWVSDDWTDKTSWFLSYKSEAKTCQREVSGYKEFISARGKRSSFTTPSDLNSYFSERFKNQVHASYKPQLSECGKDAPEQGFAAVTRFYTASAKLAATSAAAVDEMAYIDSVLPGKTTMLDGVECTPVLPEVKNKCEQYRTNYPSCSKDKAAAFKGLVDKTISYLSSIEDLLALQRECIAKITAMPNARAGRGFSPEASKKIKDNCDRFSAAAEILKNEIPWARSETFLSMVITKKPNPRNGDFRTTYDLSEAKISAAITKQLELNRKGLSDAHKKNLETFRCLSSETKTNGDRCNFTEMRSHLETLPALESLEGMPSIVRDPKGSEAHSYYSAEKCIMERSDDRSRTKTTIDDAFKGAVIGLATLGVGAYANGIRVINSASRTAKVKNILMGANTAAGFGMAGDSGYEAYKTCQKETSTVITLSQKSNLALNNVCSHQKSDLNQAQEQQTSCLMSALMSTGEAMMALGTSPTAVRLLSKFGKSVSSAVSSARETRGPADAADGARTAEISRTTKPVTNPPPRTNSPPAPIAETPAPGELTPAALYQNQQALQSNSALRQQLPENVELSISAQSFDGPGMGTGDFAKVIKDGDETVHILAGDMVGHGSEAAEMSVRFHNALANEKLLDVLKNDRLAGLDKALSKNPSGPIEGAISHIKLNTRTGVLEAEGGSDTIPYLIKKDGQLVELNRPAKPVGYGEYEGTPQSFQMQPGDRVVVVSDGVADSIRAGQLNNGNILRSRLSQAAIENQSSDEIVKGLKSATGATLEDDAMVLAFRWNGPPAVGPNPNAIHVRDAVSRIQQGASPEAVREVIGKLDDAADFGKARLEIAATVLKDSKGKPRVFTPEETSWIKDSHNTRSQVGFGEHTVGDLRSKIRAGDGRPATISAADTRKLMENGVLGSEARTASGSLSTAAPALSPGDRISVKLGSGPRVPVAVLDVAERNGTRMVHIADLDETGNVSAMWLPESDLIKSGYRQSESAQAAFAGKNLDNFKEPPKALPAAPSPIRAGDRISVKLGSGPRVPVAVLDVAERNGTRMVHIADLDETGNVSANWIPESDLIKSGYRQSESAQAAFAGKNLDNFKEPSKALIEPKPTTLAVAKSGQMDHVVAGDSVLVLRRDGSFTEAKVVGRNPNGKVKVEYEAVDDYGEKGLGTKDVPSSEILGIGSSVSVPRHGAGYTAGIIRERLPDGRFRVEFEVGEHLAHKDLDPVKLRKLEKSAESVTYTFKSRKVSDYIARNGGMIIVDYKSPGLQSAVKETTETFARDGVKVVPPGTTPKQEDIKRAAESWLKSVDRFESKNAEYTKPRDQIIGGKDGMADLGKIAFCEAAVCRELSMLGSVSFAEMGFTTRVVKGRVSTDNASGGHAWIEFLDPKTNKVIGLVDNNFTRRYYSDPRQYYEETNAVVVDYTTVAAP